MAGDRSFVQRNQVERERLHRILERADDEQLGRLMGDGRTIATILTHVAFWDQRSLVLIARWERNGFSTTGPVDPDLLNDTVLPFTSQIPPRQAANLAIQIIDALDQKLETLSPELLTMIQAESPRTLDRSPHRREHHAEMDQALG